MLSPFFLSFLNFRVFIAASQGGQSEREGGRGEKGESEVSEIETGKRKGGEKQTKAGRYESN